MTTEHDFEMTISLGERALGYLKFNVTPAIPKYYELWYSYAGGQNKSLVKAIQELLAKNEKLTVDETERLYSVHLCPYRFNEQVEQVGCKITDEIQEIMQMVGEVSASTSAYGNTLKGTMGTLDEVDTTQKLRTVVESLISSTKEMIRNTDELEGRLEDSRRQIAELNSNLEAIRTESMTDQLTGIANRKHFDHEFSKAIAAAGKTASNLCLLVVDIDHFKKFNDTYGHQTGDQVLRLVAHTLKTNVKGRDLAARYGGEEFAVVLPKTKLKDAVSVADQIRMAVMNKELVKKSTSESLGRVTVSIGVSQYQKGDTAESVFQRADTCLYAAKNAGRNRVMCETDPEYSNAIKAA